MRSPNAATGTLLRPISVSIQIYLNLHLLIGWGRSEEVVLRVCSVSFVTMFFLGLAPFSIAAQEAREHVIFILATSYFPDVTEVREGDTVRFVNVSGSAHSVRHQDGLWETLEIGEGQELIMSVSGEMAGGFQDSTGRFSGGLLRAGNENDGN